MSVDGKKGEDMDSLFEGMVLFNPGEIEVEADNGSDDCSQSQSQPLDENLFSDLTLVVDPLQNLEVTEAEPDLQSQSSGQGQGQGQGHPPRRRKRSGLKIGYGRDDLFSSDLSRTPSPLPLPPQPIIISDTPTHGAVTVTENPKHGLDSEAQFLQIKATIHEKLEHASQLVKSASSARKDSIRNRRLTAQNANLASLKHMELEKQLEQACEAEDFERAEKVSENLSAAENEKQAFANSLRRADAFLDALDLKLQHALDSYLSAQEQCAILLHHYATVSKAFSFLHLLVVLFL